MKINELVFDAENKEFVKITNGIPVIEGKPEITPTEGIALRIINFHAGNPVYGWTYRKVNPARLGQNIGEHKWFADAMEKSLGRI